jgi:hypothetical protein
LLRNLFHNFFFPAKGASSIDSFVELPATFIERLDGIDYAVNTIAAGQVSQGKIVATCL